MKSKEVSRFCPPEVEYIVINCRPHYLSREFSAKLFVAVYLPPQTDAGSKTALSQLYKEISKQEITHLGLDKDFFYNKDDAQDILQTPNWANIPVICKRKRRRYRGHRAGCLVRTRRRRLGSCRYHQYYSPTCNHWTIN